MAYPDRQAEPIVEARGISKYYGGAHALVDVDVSVRAGEVHALVGENGAGKSTLGKLISGLIAPTDGTLMVHGEPHARLSPREAIRQGITIIEQELTLLTEHSVAENVFLGVEPRRGGVLRKRVLLRRFIDLRDSVGFDLPAGARVGTLSVADQQKVEILRALAREARLIVMDEPTAALTRDEAAKLLEIIRRLRQTGTTVIYVSHNLADVLAIADTVTILKDGRVVRTGPAAEETADTVVTGMLGRSLGSSFPARGPRPVAAPVVLAVREMSRPGVIEDISFEVSRGEIVGLAGLVGSGRSEVARAVSGADRIASGEIELQGEVCTLRSPRTAIDRGVALVPESRKDQGLLMGHTVGRNLGSASLRELASGSVLRPRREAAMVRELIERLDIRPTRHDMPIALLSGGNQQKVLFGKWLARDPALLIADEPTRGVDIGARRAIYDLIVERAARGVGVLLISSELEEVMHLSHRILVMRSGRIVGEFDGTATEDELMRSALAAGAH